MKKIKAKGSKVIIYEPTLNTEELSLDWKLFISLINSKKMIQAIIGNRYDNCLDDVIDKVIPEIFSKEIKKHLELN